MHGHPEVGPQQIYCSWFSGGTAGPPGPTGAAPPRRGEDYIDFVEQRIGRGTGGRARPVCGLRSRSRSRPPAPPAALSVVRLSPSAGRNGVAASLQGARPSKLTASAGLPSYRGTMSGNSISLPCAPALANAGGAIIDRPGALGRQLRAMIREAQPRRRGGFGSFRHRHIGDRHSARRGSIAMSRRCVHKRARVEPLGHWPSCRRARNCRSSACSRECLRRRRLMVEAHLVWRSGRPHAGNRATRRGPTRG